MPRVPIPTQELPTVDPGGGGAIPYMRATGATPDAFGAQVGEAAFAGAGRVGRAEMGQAEAVQKLGTSVEQFGDVLAKHAIKFQTELNETDADEKFLGASMKLGELEAWHRSLEGKAALDAMPEYSKRAMAIREEFKNQLSSNDARRKFDKEFSRRLGYSLVDGGRYSAGQFKVYEHGVSTAKVAQQTQDLTMATSTQQIEDGITDIEASARKKVFQKGGSEEEADIAASVAASNAIKLKVEKLVAENHPQDAQEIWDKFKKRVTDPTIFREAASAVTRGMDDLGSRQVADQVQLDFKQREDHPGQLAERQKQGQAQAEILRPGDSKFADMVRTRVNTDYREMKGEKKDREDASWQIAQSEAKRDVDGKLVTNVEQFTPSGRKAYNDLPEEKKSSIDRALKQNAKFGVEWNDERRADYFDWAGKAMAALAGDETKRQEFLDKNIMELDMPWQGGPGGKNKLWELQQRVRTHVTDTHIVHATSVVSPMLRDAGIIGDPQQEYKFRGTYADAVSNWMQSNEGRRPDDRQLMSIAAKLLKQDATPWYYLTSGQRLFQKDVPADKVQSITDSLTKAYKSQDPNSTRVPTPEEIRRTWVYQQYLKDK